MTIKSKSHKSEMHLLCALACFFAISPALGKTIESSALGRLIDQGEENTIILDCRSAFEREVQGFIKGSFWFEDCQIKEDDIPNELRGGKSTEHILCIRGKGSSKESAQKLIQSLELKTTKLSDYEGDLRELKEANGKLINTRFIHFDALQTLLNEAQILLIDVRNRTELNKDGQIRGSVCVPLHEIPQAFEKLTEEGFKERYGFSKPRPEDSNNIVLTCRSGRRVLIADERLKPLGFNNLRIYSGSFNEWSKLNGDSFNADFDLNYDVLE